MGIRFVKGNLFESRAEALVNTVNCVGVMGKGIAYQFRRAYPEMFKDYQRRCKAGQVRIGQVTTFQERGKLIVNFPTKEHWRAQSKLGEVEAGLESLRQLITRQQLSSIAIPPLGCGNGGLAWQDVRTRIEDKLGDLDQVNVEVYEPVGYFGSKVAKEPSLSLGHFVLAALRSHLARPTKLNIQKASYFFNVFRGEDYFHFKAHRYGPYAPSLDPMFATIRDYLEYSKANPSQLVDLGVSTKLKGKEADRMRSMLPAIQRAAEYCNAHSRRIEALATAHAVVAKNPDATVHDITDKFLGWSAEKSERFEAKDVEAALEQLAADGLIRKTLYGYEAVALTMAPPLAAKSD